MWFLPGLKGIGVNRDSARIYQFQAAFHFWPKRVSLGISVNPLTCGV
jgi:hypothetical protein